MSKIETVRRLSDLAPPPERLRAIIELQQQMSALTEQVDHLGRMLAAWTQEAADRSQSQRQQMLDLGVLVEPLVPTMAEILRRLQAQEERLAKLEAALERVMAALPPLTSSGKDGRPVQPRLASRHDLGDLPAQVWRAKPSMFGRS